MGKPPRSVDLSVREQRTKLAIVERCSKVDNSRGLVITVASGQMRRCERKVHDKKFALRSPRRNVTNLVALGQNITLDYAVTIISLIRIRIYSGRISRREQKKRSGERESCEILEDLAK